MKKIISLLAVFACIFSLCACNKEKTEFYEEYPTGDEFVTIEIKQNPEAVITLSNGAKIKIELYYDAAPNAVTNFIAFARENIYEKMCFSQVKNNCIVMTDYVSEEDEAPYYTADEKAKENNGALSHKKGVVSMVRTTGEDTLTGQFFILTKDQQHLDNYYSAFGVVTEGLEEIEKIAQSQKAENEVSLLAEPVVIKSVRINTHGAKFPNPTIILK